MVLPLEFDLLRHETGEVNVLKVEQRRGQTSFVQSLRRLERHHVRRPAEVIRVELPAVHVIRRVPLAGDVGDRLRRTELVTHQQILVLRQPVLPALRVHRDLVVERDGRLVHRQRSTQQHVNQVRHVHERIVVTFHNKLH